MTTKQSLNESLCFQKNKREQIKKHVEILNKAKKQIITQQYFKYIYYYTNTAPAYWSENSDLHF